MTGPQKSWQLLGHCLGSRLKRAGGKREKRTEPLSYEELKLNPWHELLVRSLRLLRATFIIIAVVITTDNYRYHVIITLKLSAGVCHLLLLEDVGLHREL